MLSYAVRRLALGVPFALAAATAVFVLLEAAPGGPADHLIGDRPVPPDVRERIERAYGLDRGPAERYAAWIAGLARGDLGWSHSAARPVVALLADALPATLLLSGAALAVQALLGIVAGVVGAAWHGRWLDRALGVASLALCATPVFWAGLVAILGLAWALPVFPSSGMLTPGAAGAGRLARACDLAWHLVLPACVLGITSAAAMSRFVRASVVDALGQPAVRAARARGLAERRVLLGHALRSGLGPLVTLTGLSLPALVSGSLVVEVVFSWPGMGRLTYEAILADDVAVVLASTLLSAALVAAGSLAADLALAAFDPRVRLARSTARA
jgi:peptide/nickel transport system permease protein